MRTVLVGERPREVEEWLERRRALGQDLFDEVWEGEYHVAPAPHGRHGQIDDQLARILGERADGARLRGSGPCNIGQPDDYRVPDRAYFRDPAPALYNPTAAVVVEIVSPGDESRAKLGFYHRCGVEEVLVVDPDARTVEWYRRGAEAFTASEGSPLLGVSGHELEQRIDWPD